MFSQKANQFLWLVLTILVVAVGLPEIQRAVAQTKPTSNPKKVGVGIISAFPKADEVEEHLRNYLGQMRGIKYILQPSTPEGLFEELALITKDGKQIDLLVVAGHGAAQFPNIKLKTKSLLPKDVDVTYQQEGLKKKLQERADAENIICTLRQKPKLSEDEQIALEQAQARLENILPEQIEIFRRMLEAMDRVENALAPDAKIWLLNCSAAATPTGEKFVKDLGQILLRKRGGFIEASKVDIDLLRPQFWSSGGLDIGEYGVQGMWVKFPIAVESNIKPFLFALPVNFAPACIDLVSGRSESATLRPVVNQAEDSGKLKYTWQNARPTTSGETASFSISDMISGLVKAKVKVTDQRGREGEGVAYLSSCKLQIKLSNEAPITGTTISANAVITNGYPVPANAKWKWAGIGGVKPKPGGKEITEVLIDGDGELELQLEKPDEPNAPRLLAIAKVPIKATALVLSLTVPAEVMETEIFSASVAIPATAQQKAPDGKVTTTWTPRTVGAENTPTPKLQFLKATKEPYVIVSLNTGHHADKPIVVKPAKFAASAAGSWNTQKSPDRAIALERTPAKIEQHINFNGPAIALASVGGKVEAWLGELKNYYGEVDGPDPTRVDKELREKLKDEKGELKALTMGDFKGYLVETKPVFSRGGWSDAGFRDCGVGAYGHGFATKGWALIEVRYNISGSGWFDNRFQSFMEAQAAAGQAEARAIVNSLKLTPSGEFTKMPYTGPNLNVTVPAETSAEPTTPKPTTPTTPTTPKPTPPTTTPTPPATGAEAAAQSEALIKEGSALHDQKKFTEAISLFTKAISFTPNSADAYRRRAMSKRELKDYAGAIADFSKAITIAPNNARAYAGRGLAKERNGDVNGAVNDYTRAIQSDPRYENAYFYRALIRYDQKDYRGALTDYDQVIGLNPKNAYAWNNRGSAKERLGDLNGAIRDYEQALALDPNYETARHNLERLKTVAGAPVGSAGAKKETGTIDLSGTQWNWVDPKADAAYTVASNALTITASNGNDLWYQYNVDAPRLVKRVSGNFVLQVRVRGEFRDNYNGAGLLVYAGRDAVIRFERGNQGADGGQRVWILGYQNQRETGRLYIPYTANDVYLKLARNGNQFIGYASSDGANWIKVGALNATLPTSVETGLALVNQHNNNVFRATFSELELINTTSPSEAAMPTAGATIGGKTTWGTNYQSNSRGDVFAGGNWTNAQNGSDWLQRDFEGLYNISEIRIATAGTDVTTKGSRIVIKLQNANGEWVTIDELRETNINLSKLSYGGIGNSIPNYRKVLPAPMTAKAFRLELSGNGWFSASDIKLVGNRVGSATSSHSLTGAETDGLYFTISHNYAMRVRRISGGYFVEAWCGKTPEPTRGSCYNKGTAQLMSDGKTLHYIGKDVEGYCCGNNVEWYGEFVDAQTFRGFDGGRVWPIGAPTPPPLPINRSGGELSKIVR